MLYDAKASNWTYSGSTQGIAKVQLYLNSATNVYRVVGWSLQDREVYLFLSLYFNQNIFELTHFLQVSLIVSSREGSSITRLDLIFINGVIASSRFMVLTSHRWKKQNASPVPSNLPSRHSVLSTGNNNSSSNQCNHHSK